MQTPNDILVKILDAIDFQDDKEAFVKEFLELIYAQAVTDLVATLPQTEQDEIKNAFQVEEKNAETLGAVMKAHFSHEQGEKALQEATEKTVADYLEYIDSSLSDEQREKIFALTEQV